MEERNTVRLVSVRVSINESEASFVAKECYSNISASGLVEEMRNGFLGFSCRLNLPPTFYWPTDDQGAYSPLARQGLYASLGIVGDFPETTWIQQRIVVDVLLFILGQSGDKPEDIPVDFVDSEEVHYSYLYAYLRLRISQTPGSSPEERSRRALYEEMTKSKVEFCRVGEFVICSLDIMENVFAETMSVGITIGKLQRLIESLGGDNETASLRQRLEHLNPFPQWRGADKFLTKALELAREENAASEARQAEQEEQRTLFVLSENPRHLDFQKCYAQAVSVFENIKGARFPDGRHVMQARLSFAKCGIKTYLCKYDKERDKVQPQTKDGHWIPRTCFPEQIRMEYESRPSYQSWAIQLGDEDLALGVLDLDVKDGKKNGIEEMRLYLNGRCGSGTFDTMEVACWSDRTKTGGLHIFMALPPFDTNTNARGMSGVEFKRINAIPLAGSTCYEREYKNVSKGGILCGGYAYNVLMELFRREKPVARQFCKPPLPPTKTAYQDDGSWDAEVQAFADEKIYEIGRNLSCLGSGNYNTNLCYLMGRLRAWINFFAPSPNRFSVDDVIAWCPDHEVGKNKDGKRAGQRSIRWLWRKYFLNEDGTAKVRPYEKGDVIPMIINRRKREGKPIGHRRSPYMGRTTPS